MKESEDWFKQDDSIMMMIMITGMMMIPFSLNWFLVENSVT